MEKVRKILSRIFPFSMAENTDTVSSEKEVLPEEDVSAAVVRASGQCGDNAYWTLSEDGVLTISGTGNMWEWVDRRIHKMAPWHAWEWKIKENIIVESVKVVIVESGIVSIGSGAFEECRYLKSVTIPDSVTRIGSYAFEFCHALKSVTIPDGVTYIGDRAFNCCQSLESVIIPDSVTRIGSEVFRSCHALKSVTIPDSVTSIGGNTFENCTSLTSVTIPAGVTHLFHFNNCNSLTEINVHRDNAVYSSKNGVVFNKNQSSIICFPKGKTGEYIIPDSVTSIGDNAFSNCNSLTSVTIPDSVTSIGIDAFGGCSSITSVTIPDSVTSIGNHAFQGCSSLTSVTIPDSITSIGDYAFRGCRSLTSVTIGDSVTDIGRAAFAGCESLTEVTIPAGVTNISKCLFEKCKSLASVKIPDSARSIGDRAFEGCESLTNVKIPAAYIGYRIFRFCTSLTSVTIGENVKKMHFRSFEDCRSLTEISVDANNRGYSSKDGVLFNKDKSNIICFPGGKKGSYTIPDSVTKINNRRLFYENGALSRLTIPAGVQNIKLITSLRCNSLVEINVVPENSIYSSVDGVLFNKDQSCLLYVPDGKTGEYVIPDSVRTIGESAFSNCSALTGVTIGNSVTSIGDMAFSSCKSLTSITIPDSVTDIGSRVFADCTSLMSITIGKRVTNIGENVFLYCKSLKNIVFKGNAPEIVYERWWKPVRTEQYLTTRVEYPGAKHIVSEVFVIITATAYYPADNPTWTEDVRQKYGNKITWVPMK